MRSQQTPPPADPPPPARSEPPATSGPPATSEHPAATPSADPVPLPPERRAELLAASDEADLVALADRCLEGAPGTRVSIEPTVGTIPFCVREPVVGERFVLADVLASIPLDGLEPFQTAAE